MSEPVAWQIVACWFCLLPCAQRRGGLRRGAFDLDPASALFQQPTTKITPYNRSVGSNAAASCDDCGIFRTTRISQHQNSHPDKVKNAAAKARCRP